MLRKGGDVASCFAVFVKSDFETVMHVSFVNIKISNSSLVGHTICLSRAISYSVAVDVVEHDMLQFWHQRFLV